jgi:hypothetical protein
MSPKMTRHRNAFSRAPAKSVISLRAQRARAVVQLPSESPRKAGHPPSRHCRRNSCSIPDPLAADDSELRPLRPETSPRRWFGKISDNSNLPMKAAAPRGIGPVGAHSAHPFYGADLHIDQIDPGVSKSEGPRAVQRSEIRFCLAGPFERFSISDY